MKIYTRHGDTGETSLVDGIRVSKSNLRLECYGTVDELNSYIGMLRAQLKLDLVAQTSVSTDIDQRLNEIQNTLFNLGSQLACESEETRKKMPALSEDRTKNLENWIDADSAKLAPLKTFILPTGTPSAAICHVCRTVCRRTERLTVALYETSGGEKNWIIYLNRLSDFLFTQARVLNHLCGIADTAWQK